MTKREYRVYWRTDGREYMTSYLLTKEEAQYKANLIDSRLASRPNAGAWTVKERNETDIRKGKVEELRAWCIDRHTTLRRSGKLSIDAWQSVGDSLAFMAAEGMALYTKAEIEAVEAWWSQRKDPRWP